MKNFIVNYTTSRGSNLSITTLTMAGNSDLVELATNIICSIDRSFDYGDIAERLEHMLTHVKSLAVLEAAEKKT